MTYDDDPRQLSTCDYTYDGTTLLSAVETGETSEGPEPGRPFTRQTDFVTGPDGALAALQFLDQSDTATTTYWMFFGRKYVVGSYFRTYGGNDAYWSRLVYDRQLFRPIWHPHSCSDYPWARDSMLTYEDDRESLSLEYRGEREDGSLLRITRNEDGDAVGSMGFEFDQEGRVASAGVQIRLRRITYDSAGRLQTNMLTDNRYQYDAAGNLRVLHTPAGCCDSELTIYDYDCWGDDDSFDDEVVGTLDPDLSGHYCTSHDECYPGLFCDLRFPDGFESGCYWGGFCNSDDDCDPGFVCDDRDTCHPLEPQDTLHYPNNP